MTKSPRPHISHIANTFVNLLYPLYDEGVIPKRDLDARLDSILEQAQVTRPELTHYLVKTLDYLANSNA